MSKLVVAMVIGVVVISGSPAFGQGSTVSGGHSGGSVDGSGSSTASGGIVVVGASGPGDSGIGAGADPCRYQVGTAVEIDELVLGHLPGAPARDPADAGADTGDAGPVPIELPWVLVTCPTSYSGGAIADIFQVGEAPPTAGLLEAARRALVIPLPVASFSPAADAFQIVGIETWVWVDELETVPLSATACVPPGTYACATVVASFVTLRVDMADGSPVLECEGPGVSFEGSTWEPGDDVGQCEHVYIDPPPEGATYPVAATTVWAMTWSCAYDADLDGFRESSCGGGPLPAVGRVGAPADLEVREYQAVATIAD